jgi:ABC-type transporter MlaC component
MEEINEFKKLLGNSYEQKMFVYKNITFDFTNYERKSVDHIMD